MAVLFYTENHINYFAHFCTQFLGGIAIHNCKLNKLLAVNHSDQFTRMLVSIGIYNAIHLDIVQAEQHMLRIRKQRDGQIGGQISESVDRSNMGNPTCICLLWIGSSRRTGSLNGVPNSCSEIPFARWAATGEKMSLP